MARSESSVELEREACLADEVRELLGLGPRIGIRILGELVEPAPRLREAHDVEVVAEEADPLPPP